MSEAKTVCWNNYYLCECGEHWEDRHDCTCNDHCPSCGKEIQPYISNDGSLTSKQVWAAFEKTIAVLELCLCANCDQVFREDDLAEIQDLGKRMAPGDEMPSGECPDCGMLAYRVAKPEEMYVVVHRHEYGSTPYLFLADRQPSPEELISKLKIDFELEKNEELEILGPVIPVRLPEVACGT